MEDHTRDHLTPVPPFFKFLVGAKIFLAVVVLGLAAYGATFDYFFGGNGYAIFCAIAIFITEGWYLVSNLIAPVAFNCWPYLVLSCFQVIWWLSCWADLAAWAAAYSILFECDTYGGLFDCPENNRKTYRNVMGAAAGVGALEWILCIVSLVVFGIALHKQRRSGAPYSAGGAWRTTPDNPQATPGAVEAQNGKAAMQQPQSYPMDPTPQPAMAPQPVYQQPVYQQPQQQPYQTY